MTNLHCRSSDFSTASAVYNYPPDRQLEPTHMVIDITLNIENRYVVGTNEITFVSNSNIGQSLTLNAVDFDYVKIDQQGLTYHYDEELIKIHFDAPIPKGEKRSVKIQYKVSNPAGGLYFFYPDKEYPDLPVYAAADHESTRARYWIPCMDYTAIRTTLEWRLTSKSGQTRLANGKFIEERDNGDGTGTTIWKHDYPCPVYIATIAVGEFTEFKDRDADGGKGPIPVAYYTSSNFTPHQLEISFKKTPDMIEWFYKKISVPFGWDKYYQYTLLDISGAMENQSLVSWNEFAVCDDENLSEVIDIVDIVNVHEMAHTYFGDMVVVTDFSHAWLKESWATMMESVYLEDHFGEDDYNYDLYLNAVGYMDEADSKYIRSVVNNKYESSWEMFDRHLYPGGGFRLHMLRKLLGDTMFWEGVRDYVKTHQGKVVETIDFKRKLEEHSGRDLGEFFDQWLFHAQGYPKLKVSYSYDDKKKQVKLGITQDQIKEEGPQATPFSLALEIGLSFGDNSSYDIHTVQLNGKSHTFTFKVYEEPKHVRIDPENKILHKLDFSPPNGQLVHQLKNSNMLGRIQAASFLAKKPKMKNIEAIRDAALKEPFWGARVEMAKALSSANSNFAISPLLEIAKAETNAKAKVRIYKELGTYQDEETVNFLNSVLKSDNGPGAKGSALESLAKQLREDSFTVIKEYTTSSSHRDFLATLAYSALAHTRSEDAMEYLLVQSEYGKSPFRTRRSIVSSLTSLHMWQTKANQLRIKDKLIELLRDKDPYMRLTSAVGLQSIDAKDAIPKLRLLQSTLVHQEALGIDKRITALQKSKPETKFADMEKKVEELNKTIQDMDKRLQDIEASKE